MPAGRPRKHPLPDPTLPKRPRGRTPLGTEPMEVRVQVRLAPRHRRHLDAVRQRLGVGNDSDALRRLVEAAATAAPHFLADLLGDAARRSVV